MVIVLTNCVAVRNAWTTPPANAAQFRPPTQMDTTHHNNSG